MIWFAKISVTQIQLVDQIRFSCGVRFKHFGEAFEVSLGVSFFPPFDLSQSLWHGVGELIRVRAQIKYITKTKG